MSTFIILNTQSNRGRDLQEVWLSNAKGDLEDVLKPGILQVVTWIFSQPKHNFLFLESDGGKDQSTLYHTLPHLQLAKDLKRNTWETWNLQSSKKTKKK